MYECLIAADRSLDLSLGEFARLEDSLVLEERNYREVWKLPWTESIPMAVDAESGALLELFRSSNWSEAPRIVSVSQAEGIARGFLKTAYPEFRTRSFRFDEACNEGDRLLICFAEDHGADMAQFRNWIDVEVDATNGRILTYRATYVRVETDPIRVSADAAKSRAMEHLFPADEERPGPFSRINVQACVEPVSRGRAKAHWSVFFTYQAMVGDEIRDFSRGIDVDCSTGEIIVREFLGKMD